MSDDENTPRAGPRARRLQTQEQRDSESLEARRRRELAAPHHVDEEITGRYEGEALEAARARRPTPERLRLLEREKDTLAGKLEILMGFADRAEAERERRAAADHAARAATRRMIIPIIKAVCAGLALIAAAILGHGGLP